MYARVERLFLANFWERGVQLAKLSAAFGQRVICSVVACLLARHGQSPDNCRPG